MKKISNEISNEISPENQIALDQYKERQRKAARREARAAEEHQRVIDGLEEYELFRLREQQSRSHSMSDEDQFAIWDENAKRENGKRIFKFIILSLLGALLIGVCLSSTGLVVW